MLGAYARDNGAAGEVVCVKMDAMSETVTPGVIAAIAIAERIQTRRSVE